MNFINPEYYNEIDFSVEISNVETKTINNIENVVVTVFYKVCATFNGESVFSQHEVYFPEEEINIESLTDFNNLSEDQVKSWIEPFAPLEAIKHSLSLRFKPQEQSEVKSVPWEQVNE